MLGLLIRWILTSFAIWLTAKIFPQFVSVQDDVSALIAGLILGLVNALVRPFIVLLTFPFTLLSMGLFLLVINAAMLSLTAFFAGSRLDVNGFWGALFGAIVISVISLVLNYLVGEKGGIQRFRSGYEE